MPAPALLLCRIGWHAASADGVWNGGYCFTRCRRCGRDMVRSLFGEWHVPKGFRVVWRDAAPRPATLEMPPEPVAEQPAPAPEPAPTPAPVPEPVPEPPLPEQRHQAPRTDEGSFIERSPFDFSEFDHVDDAPPLSGRRPVPPPPRETTRFRR